MENVKIYNGSGQIIGLALGTVPPGQVITIQKDQITPQVIQEHGESIAVANMDNFVTHVGNLVNPQYLIRQFGWQVAGVQPYKAPSRANKLQEKQEGFNASIVKNAVEAEKALDKAVTDTGTTRARVEKLTKDSAKRGAVNVVAAAAAADKAEGAGVEPPQMSPEAPPAQEPETPQETPGDVDPTSETKERGEAGEGGGEAGPQSTEGLPGTPPETDSGKRKKTAKKAGKKRSGKRKKR